MHLLALYVNTKLSRRSQRDSPKESFGPLEDTRLTKVVEPAYGKNSFVHRNFSEGGKQILTFPSSSSVR